MPWPYRGSRMTERCPCCGNDVSLYVWEAYLVYLAWERTPVMREQPPAPVLCVDHHGRPVRHGYAVTVKFHDGPIYIGILPRPNDWRHGWWWPLDRVLWEVREQEGLQNV